MSEQRPPIPASIKREVRQSCGFGCAICGLPIYDYDHIIEYSAVKEHTVENLVLLCDNHHRRKNKTIPFSEIQRAKNDPINLRTETTLPEMINFVGDKIDVYIGNNYFSKVFNEDNNVIYPLVIDNRPVISFRKELSRILLSITIYDNANRPMLIIEDNEMIMSTVVWDITYVGNTLRIDSKKSLTTIQIKFDVNKSLVIFERANYTFNNWHVVIDKSGTVLCSSYGKSQGFRGIAYGDNPNPNFGFVFADNTKNTGVMLGQGEESGRYNPIIRLK